MAAAAAGKAHHPPATGVGHNQNQPVPIGTPIHIPLVEVILELVTLIQEDIPDKIQELVTLIQEDIPDKTQEVIQELVVTLTSILVEPILEGTRIRIQQVDTQPQEDILIKTQREGTTQIRIQLLEATPTNIQAGLVPTKEDIPTSTQLEEVIPISIQVLGATQLEVAILTKGPRTSTQQQVVTQSEVGTQDKVGVMVRLVGTQGVTRMVAVVVTLVATLVAVLVVTQTGTQIIRSSVLALVEEATDMVVMVVGWEALLSLVLCRVWDTSPSLQVLPKKPLWQLASALWLEWPLDTD